MAWKDSVPPAVPLNLSAERVSDWIALTWDAPTTHEPLSYIIYRSRSPVFSRENVLSIAGVTGRNETRFLDHQPPETETFYVVSALDRLFNEGKETPPIRVQTAKSND